MKISKQMMILGAVVVIGGGILTVGNGCGRSLTASSGVSNLSSTGGSSDTDITSGGSGIEVIPGARTVSLVYSKQALEQLTSCTGLAKPSDKTLATYEQKQGAISTYGYADTITSPMMMAITSIAGEVCNDLIAQESKGARLFEGFDMAGSTLPNANALGESVSRLALSCWQRNQTNAERDVIVNMVTSSVAPTEARAGRKAALLVCTAMLSSLDSLLN